MAAALALNVIQHGRICERGFKAMLQHTRAGTIQSLSERNECLYTRTRALEECCRQQEQLLAERAERVEYLDWVVAELKDGMWTSESGVASDTARLLSVIDSWCEYGDPPAPLQEAMRELFRMHINVATLLREDYVVLDAHKGVLRKLYRLHINSVLFGMYTEVPGGGHRRLNEGDVAFVRVVIGV